jgi:hypothetical protein
MTERTARDPLLVRHAKGGQQGDGDFYFRMRQDGGARPEESGGPLRGQGGQQGPVDLAGLLRGWEQMKANYSGWPTFVGMFVNYPRFKKEWRAYRETYHSVMSDDLAAKILGEKCVKGNAWKMVGHLEI